MSVKDMLVVGSVAVDHIGFSDKLYTDILTTIQKFDLYFGGRGGNVAAYAALFGTDVSIAASVGSDFDGTGYEDHLDDLGIDTSYLMYSKKYLTPRFFSLSDTKHTQMAFYGGSDMLDVDNFREHIAKVISRSRHYSLFATSEYQDINQLCLSRSRAKIKAYAPAHNVHRHSFRTLEKCMRHADVLFINQWECGVIESKLGKNIGKVAKDFDISAVVITRGKNGSRVVFKGRDEIVPICRTKKIVDPTGAGDAYAGAFFANYIKTEDPLYSARVASSVASFVIEQEGCQTSRPSPAQVLARARSNYRMKQ